MSMNDTPKGERIQIALFGKRNAGKSSLINAITDQDLAIVSEVKGTTTDPVYKAMELLPLGPVTLVDTPGLDDEGELGMERIKRARKVLNKTDIALIVVDANQYKEDLDYLAPILELIRQKDIPDMVIVNKSDLVDTLPEDTPKRICVSATDKTNIHELKERMAHLIPDNNDGSRIVGDLLKPGDFVVLVVPIDSAAPKGRLILPQQQTIRDVLESEATAIVVREFELSETLKNLGKKPALVITDSQAFEKVSADTPADIPLTSFSILFARYKGDLATMVQGAAAASKLQDGDTVLMAEGCTHHRQCDDIGTVKLPKWLTAYTGKKLNFETCSGGTFPDDLSKYALIVHCGACTLNKKEMAFRIKEAKDQGIPIVNYGIMIAQMNGILARSIEPLPDIHL